MIKIISTIILLFFASNCFALDIPPLLQVTENDRFFEAGGETIFLLADTAWWGLRLTPEEIDTYLETRHAQGFNATIGWEPFVMGSRNWPTYTNWQDVGVNYNGDYAFQGCSNNSNISIPADGVGACDRIDVQNEDFFEHVDYLVEKAASLGMYVGFIITWRGRFRDGGYGDSQWASLGEFYADRYGDKTNVFWVLCGECTSDQSAQANVLATAIHDNIALDQIFTIHDDSYNQGYGQYSWLDFYYVVGDHQKISDIDDSITSVYNQTTDTKPVMCSETLYEQLGYDACGSTFDTTARGNTKDIRRHAYQSVFSGAAGHTYGAVNVQTMSKDPPFAGNSNEDDVKSNYWASCELQPNDRWDVGITYPGAWDMGHLRALMESRTPMETRIPLSSASVATISDLKDDANCVLALDMTTNTGDESDLSASGYTIDDADDDISTNTTDSVTGTTSRDIEGDYDEYFQCTEANCPNLDFKSGDDFSICLWMKQKSDLGDVYQTLIAKSDVGGNQRQYYLGLNGSNEVRFFMSDDGNSYTSWSSPRSTSSMPTNVWKHICATFNDTTDVQSLYIDGSLDDTGTFTGTLSDENEAFTIGTHFNSDVPYEFFDGLVDEVLIFNDVLSSTEISDLYENGSQSGGSSDVYCTGDVNGKYAMCYTAYGTDVNFSMTRVGAPEAADTCTTYWFNPRNGYSSLAHPVGKVALDCGSGGDTLTFKSPSPGEDWVLVVDDDGENYSAP